MLTSLEIQTDQQTDRQGAREEGRLYCYGTNILDSDGWWEWLDRDGQCGVYVHVHNISGIYPG